MKVNLSNFETADRTLFDVSIIQNEIDGGTTEREQLDRYVILLPLNTDCTSRFEADWSFWENLPLTARWLSKKY